MSCDARLIDFNYAFQTETEIIVSSEDVEFPKENLKAYLRSKVFRTSSVSGTQSVVFDLKTIEEIDSFVMLPDALEGFKFSSGAIIKLQASATNVWGSPPLDITLSIDEENSMISHFFTSNQSYRFWRVAVTDPLNAYGYLEFGKCFLGKKIEINRSPSIGFSLEVSDLSKVDATPYGHKYFDIYPNLRTLEIDLNLMDKDDLYKLMDSFERVGRVAPVVFSLNSSEEIFDKDRFIIYGTFASNLKAKNIVKSYFDMPLVIEELM